MGLLSVDPGTSSGWSQGPVENCSERLGVTKGVGLRAESSLAGRRASLGYRPTGFTVVRCIPTFRTLSPNGLHRH